MGSILESTDVKNKLEDLSGVAVKPGENPYNALIEVCHGDPVESPLILISPVSEFYTGIAHEYITEIQALYAAHRLRRNAQQKQKFLDASFQELIIDPYLLRLENPHIEPGFKDTRNCMTFWGRPPIHVLELAGLIQEKLKAVAPDIWLMPQHRMHITTLELAFCRTPQEIEEIKETLKPMIPTIANYTYQHRARLVKPMISYDLSAFAVSFLPASGEPEVSPAPQLPDNAVVLDKGDSYSYHHLRRDMWDQAKAAGVTIDSRYIVPSAHITLGRYLSHKDHATPEQRKKWVEAIDEINEWLEREVWEKSDSEVIGEWVIGQERGLDVRVGTLWYGGGRTVLLGEGF
ncbi:RNA ligase/cyclic nucleotide phosphodiesterase [Xylaria bambusicola]|uniref:RNA ligase/cyclic nucleotide phosphodiesterase n=1 Tax=Xylaria bambusicola TaxID=326684 RepID=UPI0020084E5D|nr:RNA ligase/cyclic nucleotide phosphodiesterase [Xylaria bambusicola]KAI0514543.1 RNA ligase/cyclic nucleotide phosphodiesterase [Xylaria bambusicola]